MNRKWTALLVALSGAGMLAVACGSDDETSNNSATGGSGASSGSSGRGRSLKRRSRRPGSKRRHGRLRRARGGSSVKTDPHVSGDYKKWHTVVFAFDGPSAKENDSSPNPFLDHRLIVEITAPSKKQWVVPGFFAGDGKGNGSGNQWQARFTPDEEGSYTYKVSFRSGDKVSLSMALGDGKAQAPDGTTGSFSIAAYR